MEIPLVVKTSSGIYVAGKRKICGVMGFSTRKIPYILYTYDGQLYRVNLSPEAVCKMAEGHSIGPRRHEITNRDKHVLEIAESIRERVLKDAQN